MTKWLVGISADVYHPAQMCKELRIYLTIQTIALFDNNPHENHLENG